MTSTATAQNDFLANAQQIDTGVWLGSEEAARAPLAELHEQKIGSVLIVGFGLQPYHAKQLKYHQVKAVDLPVFNILQFVPECVAFVQRAHADGHSALIHCQRGKSRSASIAIAYIMVAHKVSFAEAHARGAVCLFAPPRL